MSQASFCYMATPRWRDGTAFEYQTVGPVFEPRVFRRHSDETFQAGLHYQMTAYCHMDNSWSVPISHAISCHQVRTRWFCEPLMVQGRFSSTDMLMITNLSSKKLTFCQATWDGVSFVPGLLAGVDTVEFVVRLIDTEDLLR